jgi:hypothetical protein
MSSPFIPIRIGGQFEYSNIRKNEDYLSDINLLVHATELELDSLYCRFVLKYHWIYDSKKEFVLVDKQWPIPWGYDKLRINKVSNDWYIYIPTICDNHDYLIYLYNKYLSNNNISISLGEHSTIKINNVFYEYNTRFDPIITRNWIMSCIILYEMEKLYDSSM